MLEMKIKFDDLTIQFNGQANLLKASNTTISQIKTDNENLVSSLKNDQKLALCEQKRNSATCKTQLETELKKAKDQVVSRDKTLQGKNSTLRHQKSTIGTLTASLKTKNDELEFVKVKLKKGSLDKTT